MPTVIIINQKWRVMIRTDDHLPPHVHIERGLGHGKSHMKVDLQTFVVSQVRFCTDREVRMMILVVKEHQDFLRKEWRRIYE